MADPSMEYADVVWDGCSDSECDLLEHAQYDAPKLVCGAIKGTSKRNVLSEVGWATSKQEDLCINWFYFIKLSMALLPYISNMCFL